MRSARIIVAVALAVEFAEKRDAKVKPVKGNYLLGSPCGLTGRDGILTLWDIMETHFAPYAHKFADNSVQLRLWLDSLSRWKQLKVKGHPETAHNIIQLSLKGLYDVTSALNLPVTKEAINMALLNAGLPFSEIGMDILAAQSEEVLNAALVELKSIQFFPVSPECQKYISATFGKAVAKAFPDCLDDIEETHTCFALGRYTASMFHLGRIMEAVTKLLGKKVKAKASKDDWQAWIFALDTAINAMPHKPQSARDKRSRVSEARNYLFNFKEAWRNKTMHPGRSFTQDQARVILQGASAFLESVATQIFKVKVT